MHQQLTSSFMKVWSLVNRAPLFLGLLLIFCITSLLASPVGEFPLNDDWIHAIATQRLLDTGVYTGHPYVASTLIAQVFWGALFCKFFGFSFTVLRLSTLVLALLGAWAIVHAGLTIGIPRSLAFLCGLIVFINPISLSLSYSYMTDVPFLAMTAMSGLFFLRSFNPSSHQQCPIFLGSLFAVVAFFIRQFGIVLPIAYGLSIFILVITKKQTFPASKLLWLGLPWLAAVPIYLYLSSIGANNPTFAELTNRIPVEIIKFLRHLPVALCYLGFFSLPLGIGKIWQLVMGVNRYPTKRQSIVFGLFGLFSIIAFLLPSLLFWIKKWVFKDEALWLADYAMRMPLLKGDYLHDFAIGNLHLPGLKPVVSIGNWWWIITLFSVIIASIVGTKCVDIWQATLSNHRRLTQNSSSQDDISATTQTSQLLFLLFWGFLLIFSVYNPWRIYVFDRYLLPAIVPFILILAKDFTQPKLQHSLWITIVVTVLMYIVSIVGLQDYLAWNRAAWVAGNTLVRDYKIQPELIRNVDTFNGWYNSDRYMMVYQTRNWDNSNLSGKGPWVLDDMYLITAADRLHSGYEVVERVPYFSWLSRSDRHLTILKRVE